MGVIKNVGTTNFEIHSFKISVSVTSQVQTVNYTDFLNERQMQSI